MIFSFTAAKVLLFRKYHVTNDKYFIGVIGVLYFFVCIVIALPVKQINKKAKLYSLN